MKVKELKTLLELLKDDAEVKIGYGESVKPIKFIAPYGNCIMLHSDIYMEKPEETFIKTLTMFGKNE